MKRVLPAKVEEGLQCAVGWVLESGVAGMRAVRGCVGWPVLPAGLRKRSGAEREPAWLLFRNLRRMGAFAVVGRELGRRVGCANGAKRSAAPVVGSFPLNSAFRRSNWRALLSGLFVALVVGLRGASAGLYPALHLRVIGRSLVVGVRSGQAVRGCVGWAWASGRVRKRSEAECGACMDGGCWLSADARDRRFGKIYRSAKESVP